MKRLLLTVAALVALIGAAPASSSTVAEGSPVVSGPGAKFAGYVTAAVVVQPGSQITYYNADIEKHNVVHDAIADGVYAKKKQPWCRDFPKKKCPLFWSQLIGLGETPVLGLKNLEAGQTYTFYCTLHPGMKGRLVAAP